MKADPKHRSERTSMPLTHHEHFGEQFPLKDMKVAQVRKYQVTRQKRLRTARSTERYPFVRNLRTQVELGFLDFNACLMVKRLPANQRDSYLSWKTSTASLNILGGCTMFWSCSTTRECDSMSGQSAMGNVQT